MPNTLSFRHVLRIERRAVPADDFSEDEERWNYLATVYAAAESRGGDESESGDRMSGEQRWKFTFRWGPSLASLSAADRIRWNDKTLGVDAVANVGGLNRWVEVEASERDG